MGRGRKTAPPIKEDHQADISRSTTPAWQDPHLKDRGDYTEQDIQNIQEKGGILPDFTLDEAEETHLFARVAQALSKTLTRQGLAVRHEAKAAAEPMGYRLDEHAIAIDTRRPWKDIALDLAHALGAIQVARDALNPADQPQGAAEWNRYKDKGRMVGDQLLASIGLLNSHWHENRGVIRAHALQARVMAEPDLHAPLGVYDWNAAWITGEIATRNPDPAQPLAVQPIRIPATKPEDIHLALPDDPANPLQVTDHPIITPHDDLVETTGRHLILGAGMPTMLIVDMDRSDAAGLDLVRRAATRESTFQGSVSECIRQAQATAPGYDPAPDEGPTGLWPAANMFPDPAVLPGAMPMETPDRPGPAQDAGMDGPAIGA
ncbi:hypothetical protein PMS00_06265 [Bifidobacterium longum]|uniref:hypothetical protein n=1 Tax=Bifidobacterium longum TaxID=216816 RepID=UPI002A353E9D|nr:hypothetical protein [Bifidobacterium longum]MDB6769956.1 hypothetical protein [Bifidobacterium longum]MDB6771941.1 hypothetical protein [Bifidobacterium longum]MDB6773950.1 hypothetical protein [Bifidobacterium longum]MDB6775718.1 hypothetical protein [Bifidobacterium longum]